MREPMRDDLRGVIDSLLERFGSRQKMRDSAELAARASKRLGHSVNREAVEAILTDHAAQGRLTLVRATDSDAMIVQRIDEAFLEELASRNRAEENPD